MTWEPTTEEIVACRKAFRSDPTIGDMKALSVVGPMIAVRALREAEDDLVLRESAAPWDVLQVAAWLRRRADEIERSTR